MNYRFSGHETFICKQLWPKKGYDFLVEGNNFNDQEAIIKLGVGKNMVVSIRYWMKAIGLIDKNDEVTDIARVILDTNGYDPYLEDIGSIWLFHYLLVKTQYASLYDIVFNEFVATRNEFMKESLNTFVRNNFNSSKKDYYNPTVIDKDISVFIRNYTQVENKRNKASLEDDYSGIFQELNMIQVDLREDLENKAVTYYILEKSEKASLPKEIFLFAILDNIGDGSIMSFNELISGNNSVGNIFLLNKDDIFNKIEELVNFYDFLDYTHTEGLPTIQFKEKPNLFDILKMYYEQEHSYTIS